ncbi:MAG: PilZ domain-containing protein [Alphaproteobacteria bacterium]
MKRFFKKLANPAALRTAPRIPNFLIAELSSQSGWLREAYVKEMSSSGASLTVNDTASVPDQIYISIEASSIRTDAKVIWRKNGAIGVRFSTPIEGPKGIESSIDRVRHG